MMSRKVLNGLLMTADQDAGTGALFPGGPANTCGHHHHHLHHGGRRVGAQPEEEQTEPPASVLTRRRALVPPKIPPYNVDSNEDVDQSVDKETSTRFVTLKEKKNLLCFKVDVVKVKLVRESFF